MQVWQLILLQGVIGGACGAILYAPVLLWLQVSSRVAPAPAHHELAVVAGRVLLILVSQC